METIILPTTKSNLVDTNGSYKKCEENNAERSWNSRHLLFRNGVMKDAQNYGASILIPVFLSLCFIMTMIGTMLLLVSFFLIAKVNVLRIFMSEYNAVFVILSVITPGIQLVTAGVNGVIGLGKQLGFLGHWFMAISALIMAVSNYCYEPKMESIILDEMELHMYSSLTKSRATFSPAWDYMQENMRCCGIVYYADWCGCRNEVRNFNVPDMFLEDSSSVPEKEAGFPDNVQNISAKFNMTNSTETFQLEQHSGGIHENGSLQNNFKMSNTTSFSGDDIIVIPYNKKNSTSENISSLIADKLFQKILEQNEILQNEDPISQEQKKIKKRQIEFSQRLNEAHARMIKENTFVIHCFIPNSCCRAKSDQTSSCVRGNFIEGVYQRGCLMTLRSAIKRFRDCFMAMCKLTIVMMMFELPLATLLLVA